MFNTFLYFKDGEDDRQGKRKESRAKKDFRKDRKDKGYTMFEEENSEEELVNEETK